MNQPTKLEQTAAKVRLWFAAETVDDFCEASGMDKSDARNWSADMRRRGVFLKRMPNKPVRDPDADHLSRSDTAYLRRLADALANGEDLTLEVYQHQEPEVVDQEETQRAERMRLIKEAADRQRQKVAAASAWSSVEGDDE
jgi:hypothetical protein